MEREALLADQPGGEEADNRMKIGAIFGKPR